MANIEECFEFIKGVFEKLPKNGGIECNLFWKMAEDAGLYEGGTYGIMPINIALERLVDVVNVYDTEGDYKLLASRYLYSVFKLKEVNNVYR